MTRGHGHQKLRVLLELGRVRRRLLELRVLGLAHAGQVKGALGQSTGLGKFGKGFVGF